MVYDHGDMMKLAKTSVPYTYATMVNKPPKPPCWRDFVPQSNPRQSKDPSPLFFTDLSQVSHKGASQADQLTLFGIGTSPSETVTHAHSLIQHSQTHTQSHSIAAKSHKKHRNRLHRTRSEVSIEQCDIPDTNRAITLAETKPREFGLRRTQFNAHVYIEENTKRCERWLEQVRASRPLEDVHFAHGSGVELEIPDEESGVSGHRSDPNSDVDSASLDYSLETHSLPRQSRCRSRHVDRHKARTLPLSASHVHIESIVESSEAKDTSLGHANSDYVDVTQRDSNDSLPFEQPHKSSSSENMASKNTNEDTIILRSFTNNGDVAPPSDCEERGSER